jgi:hypothetical protein
MKKLLVAAALAISLAQPATAITFPSLTTIYIGSGVRDDGAEEFEGVATSFNCSNVSGISASVRFLVLSYTGVVEASTTITIPHGGTRTASTHGVTAFSSDLILHTGPVGQGVINIESTQSGVFCTAFIVDAATAANVASMPLVRVNPHPGTVE